MLEFVLAKFWSSSANINLSYDIQFHGVAPLTKNISMYHGMGLQSVTLKPGIKNEEVQPAISLKQLITVLKYAIIIHL